mmetsp:Transcript_97895/g.281643  ORF Transcript_97895/g.281643 Transcript_97895/m.281643 type:complete len:139 (+) Transcript_97895:59-475(+)
MRWQRACHMDAMLPVHGCRPDAKRRRSTQSAQRAAQAKAKHTQSGCNLQSTRPTGTLKVLEAGQQRRAPSGPHVITSHSWFASAGSAAEPATSTALPVEEEEEDGRRAKGAPMLGANARPLAAEQEEEGASEAVHSSQ